MKQICELNDRIVLGTEGLSAKAPRITARAIVRNQSGLYAVMYAEKWGLHSLPGGGVEDGEDVRTALRREVYEETGCVCDEIQELGIVSENISKTRQYRNHVLKYIRQGNTKALVEEIEQMPSIDDDILEFYKMFDEAFINLYPDFVERFNGLLADGAAIVPKGDDILTPELRIFALIKLGITDSSKIASLLHYSANTIYNYRAKIKNKARGSRDEFEAAVRNIG